MRQMTQILPLKKTLQLLRHARRPQQCLPQEQAQVYPQDQDATMHIMLHTDQTAPTNHKSGFLL
jgi:hypothetical protein